MKYNDIREEELKNKVGEDWFSDFDTTNILGNIDFAVFPRQETLFGKIPLLWAEAKTGNYDVVKMFVQLVLTIGRARTFDKMLPPTFLGAFDYKKIAFLPYIAIQDIFYINDFNWNVAASNHESKEFQLIKERVERTLKTNTYRYDFEEDEKDLKLFIKNNVAKASEASKIKINKNNFIPIYLRWLEYVKPTIDVNWDELKKASILDSDFYLADLFVDDKDTQKIEDDTTIRDNLFVIYENQGYRIAKENIKQMFDATIAIKNKEKYQQFWKMYKRPPLREFQDYIIQRRDLLVPQDIRERKGAFFTPRKWVELSQKYLADTLGENWQDEYYVWDCAAGTGNLLAGLTNKYNIWASTLDQADVNVMHERIAHGANLLESHVFQFDFLNDDFTKLPQGLRDIINDEEKRKKLVIYINPPYKRGLGVANTKWHRDEMGKAKDELFAQFIYRIYDQMSGVIIAEFSKLKVLQAPNFALFRKIYLAKLESMFLAPADTFDNVVGQFPIGFKIWNTGIEEIFQSISASVYDKEATYIGEKWIYSYDDNTLINKWLDRNSPKSRLLNIDDAIGFLNAKSNDFQHSNRVVIGQDNVLSRGDVHKAIVRWSLLETSIYFAVRHVIDETWLNDRDQFLYPNDGWETDKEFQNDCLTYTLFNNNIQSKFGINHWIPFTEQEVDAKDGFESNFMTDFMNGKLKAETESENVLFDRGIAGGVYDGKALEFSPEATAVFAAGRELWRYYHAQENVNVNASLYDIRERFQGRNDAGKMNNKSPDVKYTELIGNLRESLKILAKKIEPKVYEHGFLKQ